MAAWQLTEWHHLTGSARCCMPMQNQLIQNEMATTHFYTKTGLPESIHLSLSLSPSVIKKFS
jgi:hypothetical protein